jgi:hypothetical protein
MATRSQIRRWNKRPPKPLAVHTVQTVYYYDHQGTMSVKSTTAEIALNAALTAQRHMRKVHYPACLAEVYDLLTGHLYAVIKMSRKTGNVRVIYDATVADARDFEDELRRRIRR